jgi:ABC-type tungstate transport system permease subunit
MAFIAFLTSPEGQKMINDFRMNGQQLFFTYE